MKFTENKAIYLQIVDYVSEKILEHKWDIGKRVFSTRELAAILEVNSNTVLRAYDYLQNLNIIENKRGFGYFVCEKAIEQIKNIRKEQFFTEDLPITFKNMQLLNVSLNELEDRYFKYINVI